MFANEVVITLGEELGTILRLGPVGHVWHARQGDDRAWCVWFEDFPPGFGQRFSSTRPSLSIGSTEDLLALTPHALRVMIERHFEHLCELLAEASDVA